MHALVGTGRMLLSRGEPREALAWFKGAGEQAEGTGPKRRMWMGVVQAWTFVSLRDMRESQRAMFAFACALEQFEDADERNRLACLTADLVEGQLIAKPTTENAVAALNCWRASVACASEPRDKLIVAANRMSAASLLGLRGRFFPALDDLEQALDACYELHDGEDVARSLLTASVATARLRLFERAANLAEDALRLALARGERLIAEEAGEVLSGALQERTDLGGV